jgi:hypothetical protein
MSITRANPEARYTQAQIDEQKREIALNEKEYGEEKDPIMKRRRLVRLRDSKSVLRQMTKGKGTWRIFG